VVEIDKSTTSVEFERIYHTLKRLCCDSKKACDIICISNVASIASIGQTRVKHLWKLDFTKKPAEEYLQRASNSRELGISPKLIDDVIERPGTRPTDLSQFITDAQEVPPETALQNVLDIKYSETEGIFGKALTGQHGNFFVEKLVVLLRKSDGPVKFRSVEHNPENPENILQGLVTDD